jgi:hypothetical protein
MKTNETTAELTARMRRDFGAYGDDVLLSEPEAAAIINFSPNTIKFWRLDDVKRGAKALKKGPTPTFLHGQVRYAVAELKRWREANMSPVKTVPARTPRKVTGKAIAAKPKAKAAAHPF